MNGILRIHKSAHSKKKKKKQKEEKKEACTDLCVGLDNPNITLKACLEPIQEILHIHPFNYL